MSPLTGTDPALLVRADGVEKVTGAAQYGDDVVWDGTLFGAVVRAERAHAIITAVDVEMALRRPGVRAVVTSDSMEGLFPYYGHHVPDHPILALDRVRHWGEPVAVIVAETAEQAYDALSDVDVSYTDLDPLMTVEEAMADGAPALHAERPAGPVGPCDPGVEGTNVGFTCTAGWGDVDVAMAAADHVVSTEVSYPLLYAYAMEPYNAQARFVRGELEVVSSAQHPFQVQRDLARVFGMSLSDVRVSTRYVGGGYGSKSYTKVEPLAAVCSRAVGGLPVKISLDVEEAIYTTRSDGACVEITTGFSSTGHILARDITITMDTGAYVDNSPIVLEKAVKTSYGPYRIPALRVHGRAVHTTTTPASSYRGFGAFHTGPASESNLDRAAVELGLDPMELRLRNVLDRGDTVIPGARPLDADLKENLHVLARALPERPAHGSLRGVGFSCVATGGGANPLSNAIVRFLGDGSVVVLSASVEMGQGTRTTFEEIVRTELGVERAAIRLAFPDTRLAPFEWTTGASRTAAIAGLSVQRACRDLQDQLVTMAATLAGDERGRWSWAEGRLRGPGRSVRSPREVMREWFGGPFGGELIGVGRTGRRGDIDPLPAFWEVGLVGAAITVQASTGEIRVDELVMVADVGKAMYVDGVRGQLLGGAMQALGAVLSEELVYDGGQLANANMVGYHVPRVGDLPGRVKSIVIERGDGLGPYGSKGVGEATAGAAGAAVFCAVAQAIGRWPTSAPLTPEVVWNLVAGEEP